MEISDDLQYTKEHEWVRVESDGEVVIGITDYAQEQLGDIVFVELPQADVEGEGGAEVGRDEPFAVVESVKTISDIYAPVSGRVTEVNDELVHTPAMVNEDCYGDGWMIRMEASNPDEDFGLLLSPEQYRELIEQLAG